MEKRFKAIDNDYLSTPDTDDFSKGDRFLYIGCDGHNRATVEVMKDMEELRAKIDKASSIPHSLLAGEPVLIDIDLCHEIRNHE